MLKALIEYRSFFVAASLLFFVLSNPCLCAFDKNEGSKTGANHSCCGEKKEPVNDNKERCDFGGCDCVLMSWSPDVLALVNEKAQSFFYLLKDKQPAYVATPVRVVLDEYKTFHSYVGPPNRIFYSSSLSVLLSRWLT